MNLFTAGCLVMVICLMVLFVYIELFSSMKTGDKGVDASLWNSYYCKRVRFFGLGLVVAGVACLFASNKNLVMGGEDRFDNIFE
jgi:uncharacterized oligopeptide transporter (OPT) family protein